MERRRAVMINTTTGQAVDPNWRPMLALDELPRANALMARNRLEFTWRFVPTTVEIQGCADLACA